MRYCIGYSFPQLYDSFNCLFSKQPICLHILFFSVSILLCVSIFTAFILLDRRLSDWIFTERRNGKRSRNVNLMIAFHFDAHLMHLACNLSSVTIYNCSKGSFGPLEHISAEQKSLCYPIFVMEHWYLLYTILHTHKHTHTHTSVYSNVRLLYIMWIQQKSTVSRYSNGAKRLCDQYSEAIGRTFAHEIQRNALKASLAEFHKNSCFFGNILRLPVSDFYRVLWIASSIDLFASSNRYSRVSTRGGQLTIHDEEFTHNSSTPTFRRTFPIFRMFISNVFFFASLLLLSISFLCSSLEFFQNRIFSLHHWLQWLKCSLFFHECAKWFRFCFVLFFYYFRAMLRVFIFS